MIDTHKSNTTNKHRLYPIIIAVVLIFLIIGVTICLSIANFIITPEPNTQEQAPALISTQEPIITGSIQVNGEPGYNVYLDGSRIGTLDSYVQTFFGIEPGPHTLMVELYGVTGSMPVLIKPGKTTSASIGLSKNQILVRMAKILGWNKTYPYNPFN